MAKGNSLQLAETFTKANGNMIRRMASASTSTGTEAHTRANGRKTRSLAMELKNMWMAQSIMGNFQMATSMVRESTCLKQAMWCLKARWRLTKCTERARTIFPMEGITMANGFTGTCMGQV